MILRRRGRVLLLLAALLVAYLGRDVWLAEMGRALVKTDPLQKAEIAVVLAGDPAGHRIMKAVEIVEEGYAPRILVNGPGDYYGRNEADLAIAFAGERGAPPDIFEPFRFEAASTLEESRVVERELERRQVQKAIVVTSDFHTRRARSIYHRHGSGAVEYVFIQADDPDFDPERWWHTRKGKKIVFLEYVKTLYSWLE